jgi:hypothetical protein
MRAAAAVQALAIALSLAVLPAAAQEAGAPGEPAEEAPAGELLGIGPARGSRFAVAVLAGPSFEQRTALRLTLEGSLVARRITPEIAFAVALPVSVSFWGGDEVLVGTTYRSSSFRIEVVPVARFLFPLPLGFVAYADAGLGFSWWSNSTSAPVGSASGPAGEFRLATGATFALGERFLVRLEPVGLGFYFGSGDGFVYSLMAGAAFRF